MSAWVMSVECSFHLDNNTVFTRLGLHTRSHGVLSFDSLFCSLRFSFFSPFPSCQLEGAPCLPQSNLSTSPWWTVTCPPSASSAFRVPHVCMYACAYACVRACVRVCACVVAALMPSPGTCCLLGFVLVPGREWMARHGLLYALMLLEGVGVLFPWNAFITVTEYFSTKLAGSDFEVCLCV